MESPQVVSDVKQKGCNGVIFVIPIFLGDFEDVQETWDFRNLKILETE